MNAHREKLAEIEHLLQTIDENPPDISDQDFENQLEEVQAAADRLLEDAEAAAGMYIYRSVQTHARTDKHLYVHSNRQVWNFVFSQ